MSFFFWKFVFIRWPELDPVAAVFVGECASAIDAGHSCVPDGGQRRDLGHDDTYAAVLLELHFGTANYAALLQVSISASCCWLLDLHERFVAWSHALLGSIDWLIDWFTSIFFPFLFSDAISFLLSCHFSGDSSNYCSYSSHGAVGVYYSSFY